MTRCTTSCGLLLVGLAILAAGCGPSGPKRYAVEGTVTYQGRPVPLGTVMFVPKDGPPSKPAVIDAEGHYRLEAVPGEQRVQVVAMPERKGGRPDESIEGGIDYTGVPETKSLVPEKYTRFHTSGIVVTVEPVEKNTIPIDLK